jgi:hypothetical protein
MPSPKKKMTFFWGVSLDEQAPKSPIVTTDNKTDKYFFMFHLKE